MKSLKNLCDSNLTRSVYEVSILGDIDDQIEYADTQGIKLTIEKWIKENYNYTGTLEISDKPNKDGLFEVIAIIVEVKNKNITSLTNGTFEWKEVRGFFDCSNCKSLKSLEGAPKKVIKTFSCKNCTSLKTLEGAPNEVGDFICSLCTSLTSLEGAPKKVIKTFSCKNCTSLKTLEGAPKKVGELFNCSLCTSLTSLNGAPKEIGKDFYCYDCKTQFTEDDVKKVSKVKREIIC